jgi:alkylation response protein AidB-like acyl-CoA dehydrogenase
MINLLDNFQLARLPQSSDTFRIEVKQFLKQAMPTLSADRRARSWFGFDPEFSQRLAERGWVGLTLPKAYGGAEMDAFSRFVLVEELLCAGSPVAAHWIADRQSGPLIFKYGTEKQKSFYLPLICQAKAFFCIGMSEPNSGSDLSSVATRAVKTDQGWRLNGQKIWTTNGHQCHFAIALVRTSGTSADRHAGLSQFIIDLSLPGVTRKPIVDLTGDQHFSEIFFENVMLNEDALIGVEGQGWDQVIAELAFERSGPERVYSSIVLLDEWIKWLKQGRATPQRIAMVGRFTVHLSTLRNMSIAVTHQLVEDKSPVIEAALVKDIATEFEQNIPALLEDEMGSDPNEIIDPNLLRALAYVSQMAPTYSLRGGTREILRGMIARGLGLR